MEWRLSAALIMPAQACSNRAELRTQQSRGRLRLEMWFLVD